jgi:radical SAM protein with 4Fe4S-binding SPASM domain
MNPSIASAIPSTTYTAFSKKLHETAATTRLPVAGSIELTFRCNFNCIHCLCVEEGSGPELSNGRWHTIIDDIARAGCLWLLITGGEPLIRKDFADIYLYAKRKGLIITVFTNGSLLTEDAVAIFHEYPPFVVEISLYGITPETYGIMTGKTENYYKVMSGIDHLRKSGVPLQLKSMIMRENIHELPSIKQFAEQLGLAYRFDPVLNPTFSGSNSPVMHMLTPDEIATLDVQYPERLKEWCNFHTQHSGPVDGDMLYPCNAGKWSFHIDPTGRMSVCLLARQQQYELSRGSFIDGFYQFIPSVLSQKTTRVTKCCGCHLRNMCGQCPGWAYLSTGNEEEPVEYLCQIAHLRASAFGLDKFT